MAIEEPAEIAQHLIAAGMPIGVVDMFEIVEIDKEQRKRAHRPERLGAPLDQGLLEVRVVIQTGQAVSCRLVSQLLIDMKEISVGFRQVFDQEVGMGLLPFQGCDVGDRFDDMRAPVGRVDFGPLNEEVLIVGERNFAGRRVSGLDGFRHLAKLTGHGAAGDLLVTGLVRDVPELDLRRVVLKEDLVCTRIDDGNNHRL